jgi:hypothetical protein
MDSGKTQHPEQGLLWAFAVGRLSMVEMDRVAAHLADCPACGRVVLDAPEDPLVTLLRRLDGGVHPTPERRGRLLGGRSLWLLAAFSLLPIAVGCGSGGNGTVDFDKDPNLKSIGAPPLAPNRGAQPPNRRPPKKAEYLPG